MAKFEYASAPESCVIVTIRESYGLFIGSEFTASADGRAKYLFQIAPDRSGKSRDLAVMVRAGVRHGRAGAART